MKKALNYSYLLSYMLKTYQLITQGFENNRTSQEKLFKKMCNFGSQEEWRKGGIVISSYLDVETTNDQFRLLNPTPLDCIAGFKMEDAVGERDFKRLPQISLNFIDVSISSYCSILN